MYKMCFCFHLKHHVVKRLRKYEKRLAGCVRYIFANLFCMSKREHL